MMAYDIKLVQVTTNLGGWGVANTDMGFGTAPFDYLLFSMWTCLPSYPPIPAFGSNGGPAYIFFFTLNALAQAQLKLASMQTHQYLFDGTFTTPAKDLRCHHLISVNCQTQTVQYYVNDVPVPLASGGWVGAATRFQMTSTINNWDFDIGSSMGVSYPAFADLWCGKTPSFVDLSLAANRRKFINRDLTPVYLGTDGSVPFGFTPQIYQTVLDGGIPDDFLLNRGTGVDFNRGGAPATVLTFQDAGACTLPPAPPSSSWAITSELQTPAGGAVGDVWVDDNYIDFDNPTIRNRFQNPDGSWIWLGNDGQIPTGISPLIFLTVQLGNPPSDILEGYGQSGDQTPWNLLLVGVDPITGQPYPPMSFDICEQAVNPNLTLTDIEVVLTTPTTTDHHITLKWSDDSGASWSNGILRSLGRVGEYETAPTWYRLGMSRNRVYELSWSGAHAEALQGAFVQFSIAQT